MANCKNSCLILQSKDKRGQTKINKHIIIKNEVSSKVKVYKMSLFARLCISYTIPIYQHLEIIIAFKRKVLLEKRKANEIKL